MGSNREKKRQVKSGVAELRRKPGWDPQKFVSTSPDEALRRVVHKERTQESYIAAERCEECEQKRAEAGDDTALCEKHLSAAFGF